MGSPCKPCSIKSPVKPQRSKADNKFVNRKVFWPKNSIYLIAITTPILVLSCIKKLQPVHPSGWIMFAIAAVYVGVQLWGSFQSRIEVDEQFIYGPSFFLRIKLPKKEAKVSEKGVGWLKFFIIQHRTGEICFRSWRFSHSELQEIKTLFPIKEENLEQDEMKSQASFKKGVQASLLQICCVIAILILLIWLVLLI